MNKRRKIIAGAIALVAIMLLALALRPAPVQVSMAVVERGHFADFVEDEGFTDLRNTYPVLAPIDGYLRRVTLEPGDPVAAGDRIFELEPAPAPALDARSRQQALDTLEATRARLEAARAEHETKASEARFAVNEFQRHQQLFQRGLVSATEMDRARSARESAESAERAAAAAVEATRYEMQNARAVVEIAEGRRSEDGTRVLPVLAPVGGVVLRRQRCCEGVIRAGDPVMELGDLDELEIQVELLSMDAVQVRPDMRVIVERWGGGQPLEGRVRRVEPAGFQEISALGVEEQRVPVWVEITSPREDWENLGQGFRVEARFILWEADDVLQVPTSAIFRRDGTETVFVVESGRARMRTIQSGRRSGLATQVTSGLEPSETVITHPGDHIADGSRVEGASATR